MYKLTCCCSCFLPNNFLVYNLVLLSEGLLLVPGVDFKHIAMSESNGHAFIHLQSRISTAQCLYHLEL